MTRPYLIDPLHVLYFDNVAIYQDARKVACATWCGTRRVVSKPDDKGQGTT